METLEIRSLASFETKSQSSGGQLAVYQNNKDNVKVMIRIRPLNEREKGNILFLFKGNGGNKKCVTVENQTTVVIEAKPDQKSFNFDFVGDESIEQDTIFSQIAKPIADGCMEGYNGSIFAYGQTGAGKTFTIQGPSQMINGEEQICGSYKKDEGPAQEDRGIMQRSFEYIFDCVEQAKLKSESASEHFEYLIRCSYLEIYNEQIMDLLEPSSVNLHIREDIKKGVYVEGLQEEVVQSASDMIGIIQIGAKNRHVGSTLMNKESSRSHSVLTTIIETKSMKAGGVWNIKTSRFHIIDLAGSERSKYTNAVGDRLKEAGMINKSLSALGNVINSLVDISEGKSRHVHYRDSKLTFLLRDSLGGNSKTVIIANVSPSSMCYGETLSTLKFAQRAKLMRNKAVINEDSSGTIQLLKSEISRLKKELAENEKSIKVNSILGTQCSVCKSIMGNEGTQEDEEEEDEMLISFSKNPNEDDDKHNDYHNGPLNEALKSRFKVQKNELQNVRKRVVHLEGLLSANLDNLSSQQKYYDNEIQKYQQQQKKLQQAIDSYEKQCARDKMIIKFREDRINKLEQNQPVTKDDQQKIIADLKKEVVLWKEASDHNSQAAKLFAEKAELQNKLDQLKNEYKQSPDSLSSQMRSLNEFNESLNQYLKLYCEESKKEVENELSRVKLDYVEKIDILNEKIAELTNNEQLKKEKYQKKEQEYQENISVYQQEIEKLGVQYQKEKQELEKSNNLSLEQIKNQIEQISGDKTEQEKELQMFRIQILEKEQNLEREKEKRSELESQTQFKQNQFDIQINDMKKQLLELEKENEELELKTKTNVEHLEKLIDTERKSNANKFKEREEEWENKMRELELKNFEDYSEKQVLEEQFDQVTDRLKSLEEENETLQQSVIYRDEQVQDLQGMIKEKEKVINSIEEETSTIKQQSKLMEEEMTYQLQTLQNKLNEVIKEKFDLEQQLKEVLKDKEELNAAINDLRDEIVLHNQQKLSLQEEILQLKSQTVNESKQIQELTNANIKQSENMNLLQEQVLASKKLIDQIQRENQDKIVALKDDFKQDKSQDIQKIKQDYEQIIVHTQHQTTNLQQNINDLKAEHVCQIEKFKETQVQLEDRVKVYESQVVQLINNHQQEKSLISEQCQLEIQSVQDKFSQKSQELETQLFTIQQLLQEEQEKVEIQKLEQAKIIAEEYEQKVEQVKNEKELELKFVVEQQNLVIEKLTMELQIKQDEIIIHDQQNQEEIVKVIEEKELAFKEQLTLIEEEKIQSYEQQESLTNEISELQDKIQELEKQVQEYEQISSGYQQENITLGIRLQQCEEQIKITEEQKGKAEQKSQSQKQVSSILEKNIGELKQQIEQIEYQKQQQQQLSSKHIEQLQTELNTILIQNQNYQDTQSTFIIDLQQQINAQKCAISKFESEILEKQESINGLKQQLKLHEASSSELHDEIEAYNITIDQQHLENKSLSDQLSSSLNQNVALQAQITNYQLECKELSLKLQMHQQQMNSVESQLTQENNMLKQDIDKINRHVREVEIDRNDSRQNVNLLKEDNLNLQKAISELQEKCDEMIVGFQNQNQMLNLEKSKINELLQQKQVLEVELQQQENIMEETITSLNEENQIKQQELEQQYQSQGAALKQEMESYKQHVKELNTQIGKLRQRNDEQNEMLKGSKDTMSNMVQKENELMKELEKNINEFKEQQEKWKRRVSDVKEERDHIKKEWERIRKENDNFRELIKLKDRQIEEQLNADDRDKSNLDKIQKENKDLKTQLTKREFEMKDLVRTLKFYSEEKSRLEKEMEKLHRENDQLVGHKNPSQKIQHHVKIKEENNKLREENFKLQEELRRKIDMIQKYQKSGSVIQEQTIEINSDMNANQDMKKLKKENITYQETINRLVDHILSQPGLIKALGMSEEINEKMIQNNGTHKVKKAMEIISLLNNCIQSKERDVKELERELKKVECRLDIVEKEKVLCKQQLELMQNSSIGGTFQHNNQNYLKKSPIGNEISNKIEQEFQMISNLSDPRQFKQNPSSRINIEDIIQDGSTEGQGICKQWPSPIYNTKHLKEKENVTAKRELYGQNRSGSARRVAAYLSNGAAHQFPK